MAVGRDQFGFTFVTPAADTQIVYVDATLGDDNAGVPYAFDDVAIGADPHNPVGPVIAYLTFAAAIDQLRPGMADWMLVKRGEIFLDFISLGKTGRSADEPIYISTYGDNTIARPLLKSGIGWGLYLLWSEGNFIIQSLDLYAHIRNPDDPAYDSSTGSQNGNSAVNLQKASDSVTTRDSYLLEDCKFSYFTNGLHTEKLNPTLPSATGGVVRRCTFDHTYRTGTHAQGAFISEVAEFTIEECFFEHNGWIGTDRANPSVPGGGPTTFNHNIYWSAYCPFGTATAVNNADNRGLMICRDNYSIDSSAAGLQMRSGGDVTGNISWRDPWPFLVGDPSGGYEVNWPGGMYGTMNGNLAQDPTDLKPGDIGGIHYRCRNNIALTFNDNLAIGQLAVSLPGQSRFQAASNSNPHDTTVDEILRNKFNSVIKGGPMDGSAGSGRSYGVIEDNHWWDAASIPYATVGSNRDGENVSYFDDTRRVETYATIVMGLASIDEFWDARRNMHRGNWDTAYMTPAVQQWIREGFAAPSGPNSPTNLTVTVA